MKLMRGSDYVASWFPKTSFFSGYPASLLRQSMGADKDWVRSVIVVSIAQAL
jgi:hypothetical protein